MAALVEGPGERILRLCMGWYRQRQHSRYADGPLPRGLPKSHQLRNFLWEHVGLELLGAYPSGHYTIFGGRGLRKKRLLPYERRGYV